MKKILAVFLALILIFTFVTPAYATGAIGEEEATTEHPETTEYPDDPPEHRILYAEPLS